MKCPKCRTALMSTDTHCPSCRTPMFIPPSRVPWDVELEARAAFDPDARRQLSRLKMVRGLVILLLGLGLGAGAVWKYQDNQSLPSHSSQVTADDLLRIKKFDELPEWISYYSPRNIDTGVQYVKVRTRKVVSKFVLLAVKDRWLLTKVQDDYHGGRVEGRLVGFDRIALPKVQASFPEQYSRLMPYQLDADHDLAGTRRSDKLLIAVGAVSCVVLVIGGLCGLVSSARPSRGATAPEPAAPPPPLPAFPPLRTSTAPASAREILTALPVSQLDPVFRLRDAEPVFQPDPVPRRRSLIVRAFFTLVWAVCFFLAAGLLTSVVCSVRAGGDPQRGTQLAEEAGRQVGPFLVLGSLALASVLGYLGRLPGTRR